MPALMLLVFAFTLFWSAALLFFLEPMVGKMMTPLLGGTPAVWNTCMVFFQAVLLAGYAYAHWTTKWLGPRAQARLQLAVLALPALTIAVNAAFFSGMLSPNKSIIAANAERPILGLLIVLTLAVAVPMFVVCTSAPLLQRWFSSTDHPAAKDPYFLYGASNLGSMLMLDAYLVLIEPFLTIRGQQLAWVAGAAVLAVLVVVCALLMWRSRPALELAGAGALADPGKPAPPPHAALDAIKPADRAALRAKLRKEAAREEVAERGPSVRPVTWQRRLRWCLLAVIPSSLMLGATTYITTDIAAIPLLWLLPLQLYLLTFIIVFAHIPPRVQSAVTLLALAALMTVTVVQIAPAYITDQSLLWLVRLGGIGTTLFSLQLLRIRDNQLIHRVMIMVMPLLVLLLVFMMLSDIRPGIVANIVLHLATLFIVAMVCHGELALDRPEASRLTEFFLWMSVGGVVGGLFNALFAPVFFNGLYEYPLMMVVACLFLPPLGAGRSGLWARRADVALAAVFVLVGALLLAMRYRDTENAVNLAPLWSAATWKWAAVALLLGGGLGVVAAWRGWGAPPAAAGEPEEDHWLDRCLDVALPAALLVLVLGLYWGLPARGVLSRLQGFSQHLHMDPKQLRIILTFGLPAVLCYTFVERSVRFGLGVGALMLAAGVSNVIDDPPLRQDRSFFGLLRVEEGVNFKDGYRYPFTRLVHGTTLHGKQLQDADLRDIPVTYYHRTGPVGQIFRTYNTDPKRPIAVIGLGTGSMATYGRPGQRLDFYDIDPKVVDISFDRGEFFTFVEDAEERGVDISLIFGDARLTIDPKGEKPRLRPLFAKKGEPTPERRYGPPLREGDKYGFIVVDAFSSDAIPVHLITEQAVKIYFDRLLEGGIVLMHISNRYLDLQPVLANIAEELGVVGYHMSDDDEDGGVAKTRSHWVALVRDKKDLDRVLQPLRWQRDDDQQQLLAVALWPSAGAPMMATSGLAYAFQALTEEQSRLAAREEGWAGEPARTEGDWEPLDMPSWLEQRPAVLTKRVEEIGRQLAKIEGPLEKAKAAAKVAEKPLEEVRKQLKELGEELKAVSLEIETSATADKARLNRKLADLEKKKIELGDREKKLQGDFEAASGPRNWLSRIEERLKERQKRYERQIERTPERQATAKRVAVWTDDYSNLLSVFNR